MLSQYLLAIDFDFTITNNDRINKSWGDRLAKRLRHLLEKYYIDIFILSAASISHIFQTIVLSGSSKLLLVILDMNMITHEMSSLAHIDHSWGETTRKKRNDMIHKITNTDNYQNVELIIASKKTNYLIQKSKKEGIPHSHVFFLDDNGVNIRFAKYHGFNAFQVDNKDKKKNIFAQLQHIEKIMI